jgi:hypothetical protein
VLDPYYDAADFTTGSDRMRGPDADIMAQLLRLGGHAERLRAGLHDDAGPRAAR